MVGFFMMQIPIDHGFQAYGKVGEKVVKPMSIQSEQAAFILVTSCFFTISLYANYVIWFSYARFEGWMSAYEKLLERFGLPASAIHTFFPGSSYKWFMRLTLLIMLLIASVGPVGMLLYAFGFFG